MTLRSTFAACLFAASLLFAGCASSLTGPDAAPEADQEVLARPFTGGDQIGEGGNGGGSTQYPNPPETEESEHNCAPDEDDC